MSNVIDELTDNGKKTDSKIINLSEYIESDDNFANCISNGVKDKRLLEKPSDLKELLTAAGLI